MRAIAIGPSLPKRRQKTRAGRGYDAPVLPTPELIRHKTEILGAKSFDPHASTWPLDVYLARNVVERRHHRAGMRYALDRFACYGASVPFSAAFWRQVPSPLSAVDEPRRELTPAERVDLEVTMTRRLRGATDLLKRKGVWIVVRVVLLDGRFVAYADEATLRLGLELLANRWRITND